MATRGHLKSVEFKQAALTATSAIDVAEASQLPHFQRRNLSRSHEAGRRTSAYAATTSTETSELVSGRCRAAIKGSPASPRFTAEETILLRGLASGASSKEMAAQMRLPRESLYRLIGDLRRKTGRDQRHRARRLGPAKHGQQPAANAAAAAR